MTTPGAGPILDRHPSPPSDSQAYPIRSIFRTASIPIEVNWALTGDFPLDQGNEGACVGFGTSAELSAAPVQLTTGREFADRLYQLARDQDRKMGQEYPSGASVLGGLKAAKALGLITEYRWASTFEEIRDALIQHGSVIMGTEWRADMDAVDTGGLVHATGAVRGGHCWTLVGYHPNHPQYGEVYKAINSWGVTWGAGGYFYLTPDGLRSLFEAQGEAAIVTDSEFTPPPANTRKWPKIPRWFREWLSRHGVTEGQAG